jgi:hypothetical protein
MLSHHQQAGMYSSVGPPGLMGDFVMQVQLAHLSALCLELLGAVSYLEPRMRPSCYRYGTSYVLTLC